MNIKYIILCVSSRLAWGSHSEKEIIIGKVIFEISGKNDVHNNYETDYSVVHVLLVNDNVGTEKSIRGHVTL